MTSSQTATELIIQSNEKGSWCGHSNSVENIVCPQCKAIIKSKRECWQEELEFLITKVVRHLDEISTNELQETIFKRIEQLKKNLEITTKETMRAINKINVKEVMK